MLRFILPFFFYFLLTEPSSSRNTPYVMRISCGARKDVHTSPANTFWYRDFGYSGGIFANGSGPNSIAPKLTTLRYFPLSAGPENCYNIERVPRGHYVVRIFFGLVTDPSFSNEPLFDVSVEGTLIYSLPPGWVKHDDERAFVEALVFLKDGTASLCFHSTGHGDPSILSIEILQVGDKAYNYGSDFGQGTIMRTEKRLNCGAQNSKFGEDYSADHWAGDRFWNAIHTFGESSDHAISTKNGIKQSSSSPNFYPEAIYQTAIISTGSQQQLVYTIDVEPNRNYSIWLHFAEIDPSITKIGQRVFDILLNGDIAFEGVDIINIAGNANTALTLNKTLAVSGRTLTITMQPKKGTSAIINAVEIFEVILAEAKTLPEEVRALQTLKKALGLPLRLGWNGDPCVPQQHPWSGANCQYDRIRSRWVIDGLGLDNQGLRGVLPLEISQLHHLQNINLSGNSIQGPIPASLGSISSLEILDLSYNFFNGSIPDTLGQLTSLQRLNLNSNSLGGKVPTSLGGRLLHRASFNFTDNAGLCGMPGLPSCRPHLSLGAKVGIALGVLVALLLIFTCFTCWWKRRQNILRVRRIAAREAPFAKARTQSSRDIQMTRHHGREQTRSAAENGPSLLS